MVFHHWFQSLNNIQNIYLYFTDKEIEAQKEAIYLRLILVTQQQNQEQNSLLH